ncbi:hypothetical protein [Gloeocapsopsis crepidinum]|uniref:hypothetical protein n=1 Tax=Gloeocapsopsis crepidinum TaxID=693223 RepID=UPI003F71E9F2
MNSLLEKLSPPAWTYQQNSHLRVCTRQALIWSWGTSAPQWFPRVRATGVDLGAREATVT